MMTKRETCKMLKEVVKENKERIKNTINQTFIKTLKRENSRAKKMMKKEGCK